jgi:DNA-binding NtrC family response regulator
MREDLYYRVSQVTMRVPSLRERKDDVSRLARAFLQSTMDVGAGSFEGFDPDALQILTEYHWPGNVRHLLNVITEVSVLYDGPRVTVDMLPPDIVQSVLDRQRRPLVPSAAPGHDPAVVHPLWRSEKESMHRALLACEGNVGRAASLLEISAATLYRKIRKYDLRAVCASVD